MGGELVRQAYAVTWECDRLGWVLTMNERAVLLYMCSRAMDNGQPPVFFEGRDALARRALGRVVPSEDDVTDAAQKERRSIYESVRQAVRTLVLLEAIVRPGAAYPGRSQEYHIAVQTRAFELRRQQAELGSLASRAWVNNKESLLKTQAHIGPKTLETLETNSQPKLVTRTPHVRPVESGTAA
jgi:hypothetical protein